MEIIKLAAIAGYIYYSLYVAWVTILLLWRMYHASQTNQGLTIPNKISHKLICEWSLVLFLPIIWNTYVV